MKKLWFKAKEYGWGWCPATWQGWIIVIIYIFLVLITFRIVDLTADSVSDSLIFMIIPLVIYTAILIAICSKTGEKPSWRWGVKSDKSERLKN